jgi:hypothetical protein
MDFRTRVQIPKPPFTIDPGDRLLFVGSCFADRVGQRFRDEGFQVVVNPYGVMYNPASILHSVERLLASVDSFPPFREGQGGLPSPFREGSGAHVAVLTLGTNHVYVEKATGEIVDNCRKRPQQLFDEQELSVDECADYLRKVITLLRRHDSLIRIILTVSPIRYAKYGFHGSQLSKATLLLAVNKVLKEASPVGGGLEGWGGKEASPVGGGLEGWGGKEASPTGGGLEGAFYFPAYEIVVDELRDYRFYASDMLHPNDQAVEYIWEQLVDTLFSDAARRYLKDFQPVKAALAHRPFRPDSPEYQAFLAGVRQKADALAEKYPHLRKWMSDHIHVRSTST